MFGAVVTSSEQNQLVYMKLVHRRRITTAEMYHAENTAIYRYTLVTLRNTSKI